MSSPEHRSFSSTSPARRLVGREILFWIFATIVGVVAAVYMIHILAGIAGVSLVKRYVAEALIAVMSLTWGSWAALLWTRSRSVRSLVTFTTQIPALWMVVIGVGVYWLGALTLPIILTLVGGGIALTLISRWLTRTLRALDTTHRTATAFIFSLLHPLLTAFSVGGFLFLWIIRADLATFITIPKSIPDFTVIITEVTWKSVLAVSIISTVVPAFISELFSRFIKLTAGTK